MPSHRSKGSKKFLCFFLSVIFICIFKIFWQVLCFSLISWWQVLALFPSSQGLEVTWSSVVKIGQSLYREGPGKDPFRPDQKTPVKNFFLAGSYTKQVKWSLFFSLLISEILIDSYMILGEFLLKWILAFWCP